MGIFIVNTPIFTPGDHSLRQVSLNDYETTEVL